VALQSETPPQGAVGVFEEEAEMARHEADREDLWRDAVGITSRAELLIESRPEPVLVGFRDNGWFSIYFGQDVMLLFTPDGGLRRAYRSGDLFRTQGMTLARLRRSRTPQETVLQRTDLSTVELAEFRAWVRSVLEAFRSHLAAGRVAVLREVNRLPRPLLEAVNEQLRVVLTTDRFLAPAIRGKAYRPKDSAGRAPATRLERQPPAEDRTAGVP
jgi:hypothetical protein